MPRPPCRRTAHGKRRRLPIRDTKSNYRSQAINSTQQTLLHLTQYEILHLQSFIYKLVNLLGLVHLYSLYHYNNARLFQQTKQIILYMLGSVTNVLRVYLHMDSFIGDIGIEEEREIREEHQRNRIVHPTFGSLSSDEIRQMTRFSHASLEILKTFFALPEHIYLHPSEDLPRQQHQPLFGCHHYRDEELILFSLYRFAHGINITAMLNRFGGGFDRWLYGFKYFVRHIHSLVYPTILGFNGVGNYVTNFPAMASAVESKCGDARARYNNEVDVAVYRGASFHGGVSNIVGLFDCRNQRTLVPGSGPAGDFGGAPRNQDAQLIQQSVYSGYKHFHGVKSLTVQLANGLSFVFNPISARR